MSDYSRYAQKKAVAPKKKKLKNIFEGDEDEEGDNVRQNPNKKGYRKVWMRKFPIFSSLSILLTLIYNSRKNQSLSCIIEKVIPKFFSLSTISQSWNVPNFDSMILNYRVSYSIYSIVKFHPIFPTKKSMNDMTI